MKQCKEFYEALERGDGYAAHMLFIPPPREHEVSREFRERSEENWAAYKAEQEYLDNLPKELMQFEIEYQKSKRGQVESKKRKGLFSWLGF